DARFRTRGEFSAKLFVAEARSVAKAGEDQLEGTRIGDVELDFLAALVALAISGTFIGDGRERAGAPETEQLVGGFEFGNAAVRAAIKDAVAFKSAGLEEDVAL